MGLPMPKPSGQQESTTAIPTTTLDLTSPLESVPGIDRKLALALRPLGLTNLGKLLWHLPFRHEREEHERPIAQLTPGTLVTARGEITATRPVSFRGKGRFEAVMADGTGRLDLVWFSQTYLASRIHPGMRLLVSGKVVQRGGKRQMANPRWSVLNDDEPGTIGEDRWRPVYRAGEGVKSWQIEKAIATALPHGLPLIEDHLSDSFRLSREMPTLANAYRMMHAPTDEAEVAEARRRLVYDELLLLQLAVFLRRAAREAHERALPLAWSEDLDTRIRARFPFTLTPSQDQVVRTIAVDLQRDRPANRLIQGDVGSGKTVVAAYAMLQAAAAGHQSVLLAPTEILAEQHYASLSKMLSGSKVNLALLTGSLSEAERTGIERRLKSGEIDIAVGTHAVLTDRVRFKSLAVAVIDEQHRFGVEQRAKMRAKSADSPTGEVLSPHVLVMTATPIPRTLAMTVFGDLDVCAIQGLPPGRAGVRTKHVHPNDRAGAYEHVAACIDRQEQAYVVVPAIESGQTDRLPGQEDDEDAPAPRPLRDVRTVAKELESTWLVGRRIAVLHGRLKRETRERIMERFRRGVIDVLVATTVIEVGVDVANATVMVIEDADRFGLAQLHQLRGRIGRGSKPGTCLLISDPPTETARQRLTAMTQTTDGFELAELDLQLRGPGDLFDTRQDGAPPLRLADLARDGELLRLARKDAQGWITRSPRLGGADEVVLKRRVLKMHGERFQLGDVG